MIMDYEKNLNIIQIIDCKYILNIRIFNFYQIDI